MYRSAFLCLYSKANSPPSPQIIPVHAPWKWAADFPRQQHANAQRSLGELERNTMSSFLTHPASTASSGVQQLMVWRVTPMFLHMQDELEEIHKALRVGNTDDSDGDGGGGGADEGEQKEGGLGGPDGVAGSADADAGQGDENEGEDVEMEDQHPEPASYAAHSEDALRSLQSPA
eukprot:scaffold50713_cov16-Tisochrysis_lutea.AAC.2